MLTELPYSQRLLNGKKGPICKQFPFYSHNQEVQRRQNISDESNEKLE